jgi:hypothetical protein
MKSGAIDPFTRVGIGLLVGATPVVLLSGVITHHQMALGEPGQSTLTVTGDDLTALMDTNETTRPFSNQSDSAMVDQILLNHVQDGIQPPHAVTPTTQVRSETEYVPWQAETDLAFVRRLAKENGFVFYLEPTIPGESRAYWGPAIRTGVPQPALTMNMGASTNVKSLSFTEDTLAPVGVSGRFVEPTSKMIFPIPDLPSLRMPPLAAAPAEVRRKEVSRSTAHQNLRDAAQRVLSAVMNAPDAVTGTGEVETVRYGHVLRPRQLVGVRGAGFSYDGVYYVRKVTHALARGTYSQRFTISREGRGALLPVVMP